MQWWDFLAQRGPFQTLPPYIHCCQSGIGCTRLPPGEGWEDRGLHLGSRLLGQTDSFSSNHNSQWSFHQACWHAGRTFWISISNAHQHRQMCTNSTQSHFRGVFLPLQRHRESHDHVKGVAQPKAEPILGRWPPRRLLQKREMTLMSPLLALFPLSYGLLSLSTNLCLHLKWHNHQMIQQISGSDISIMMRRILTITVIITCHILICSTAMGGRIKLHFRKCDLGDLGNRCCKKN